MVLARLRPLAGASGTTDIKVQNRSFPMYCNCNCIINYMLWASRWRRRLDGYMMFKMKIDDGEDVRRTLSVLIAIIWTTPWGERSLFQRATWKKMSSKTSLQTIAFERTLTQLKHRYMEVLVLSYSQDQRRQDLLGSQVSLCPTWEAESFKRIQFGSFVKKNGALIEIRSDVGFHLKACAWTVRNANISK